ncbi:hypothetical protein Nocox_31685 [Nonomuraea coxensis DSM 45129]|uniref:Cardiolipin synthase N-terminal domain-containing protein n=1 Tax=Nonomuraea coxensis DSM 45129 TaxID=1122611 RepID=A0ABX8U900_9ACTN|nr:PLD nuclease N-terminal domain-containing protein [Nonomuraea coxensis]QYC43916.1 hypothetical protein Nocox_31685 [Nonomuraea coxensis DSM 45129]
MLYLYEAMGLVTLVLWLYCLFDVITTPEPLCRNLPKIFWLVIVFLAPLVGSLVWLLAGRPERRPAAPPSAFPEYDRPGRFAATSPDDDEEFLRRCRERAEEQRRNAPPKPTEEG